MVTLSGCFGSEFGDVSVADGWAEVLVVGAPYRGSEAALIWSSPILDCPLLRS